MSKEFSICLHKDKHYYPGDTIKGYVQLDLNKSADIQCISLNLKGTVEANGEKVVVIDKTEILASPLSGQKYTVFSTGKNYKFEFQFEIPKNKPLPSFGKIHKVANISYVLIATPKKPSFNFSHTLPVVMKEVKIFDRISVDSIDYCQGIKMITDLGFTNGNKSAQWNITASRSAFVRGENIDLECKLSNFPPMKKTKAIKVSLMRYVHKTNSAKIIEKKVLSNRIIDLHITEIASTQSISITFNVPCDTPVSVFPATGRIVSISYVIVAELNMKGVKSAIKLKDHYSQEAAIVIGTHYHQINTPLINNTTSTLNRRELTLSDTYLKSAMSTTTSLAPSATPSNFSNASTISLSSVQRSPVKSFHGSLTDSDIKPLARLDESRGSSYNSNTYRKSYLTRASTPVTPPISSGSYFDPRSAPARSPPTSPIAMRYHSSYSPIDRSITPLPSVMMNDGSNATNYVNRSNSNRRAIIHEPTAITNSIIVSSPHEIGPDDVINRGTNNGSKAIVYCNDNEKVISNNYDTAKSERRCVSPLPRVPSLTRHDTISTSSSAGFVGAIDHQLQHYYTSVPPSSINN